MPKKFKHQYRLLLKIAALSWLSYIVVANGLAEGVFIMILLILVVTAMDIEF